MQLRHFFCGPFLKRLELILFTGIVLPYSVNAQQSVRVSLMLPRYNEIYIADLDLEHANVSGAIFTATIQSLVDVPLNVKLRVTTNLYLAGGKSYPDFLVAETYPFELKPRETMVITSSDLSSENSPVALDRSTYQFNEQEFEQIKSVSLATGKAPAGVYEFVLECVNDSNNSSLGGDRGEVTVTNPSRVELVLPEDGENITTLFPHFQWSSNADTAVISIYEKLPDQQSAQDVVSGVPFLKEAVPNSSSPFSNSFNYPTSGPGVRPLEVGKTYYWFVEVPASSTRGGGIQSDIWSFTIAAPGTDSTNGLGDELLKVLSNFLSGTPYEGLISHVGTPTGDAAFDGVHITAQELIDLLQNTSKEKVINVTIQ
jgi:hypothetical protein